MSNPNHGTAKWICTGCAKVVSARPSGRCHDCGAAYRRATVEHLSCDRCGTEESRRLMDRSEYDRLCEDCIVHTDKQTTTENRDP